MTNTEKENRLVYILGPDLILSQDLQQELDKHKVIIIKTDEAEITNTNPLESIIDHIKKTLDKENIKQPSKFYIHGHGDRQHNYNNNIDSQKDNNHIIELKKQTIFFTGHFLNRLQNTYPYPINFNLFSCFGGSGNKETKELKEGSSIVTNVNAKNFSSGFLDHYIQKKQLEELRLFPNSSFLEQILRNQKYSLQGGSWSYKTPDKVVTIKSERFLNPSSFNDLVEKLEKGLKHNKTLPEIVETYVIRKQTEKSHGFKNIAKYINEDIEKLNKFRISFSEEDTKAYLLGIAHYIIYSFDKLNKQTSKEKIQIEDLSKYFGLITDYINDPIFDKWPLVHTATQNGNTKILPELVKHKADIDKAENNGLSLLHIAAQSGHLEIVQKLLEYGANVNKSEKNGNSPLHLAALFGHLDIIQKLLEHKADVDKSENINAGALHFAAQNGHIEIVQKLLEYGANVNKITYGGVTSLYLAAQNGHTEIVQKLLEHGADVNKAADHDGFTPLHTAARNEHIEVAQKLLEHGADVNKAANDGASPLHLATLNGHTEIVQILFDSMKDEKLKKEQLAQSLVLAKKGNHTKNVKFLEDCISGKYEAEKIGQNLKKTMISNSDNLTLIKQKGSGIGR